MSAPVKYGIVVMAAVFFIGWSTGMGGSALPNLGFSALMGILAAGCFHLAQKFISRK